MISFETPDGYGAELIDGGDQLLQLMCDRFNETHFGGKLPPISVFAASRLVHPTISPIHALTFKRDDVPELRGLQTPWLILINKTFCDLPFLAQLLLHEMTHVFLPDEQPYHSQRFWNTLLEKWLIDKDIILGAGLNGDETPNGLTQEFLSCKLLLNKFGL